MVRNKKYEMNIMKVSTLDQIKKYYLLYYFFSALLVALLPSLTTTTIQPLLPLPSNSKVHLSMVLSLRLYLHRRYHWCSRKKKTSQRCSGMPRDEPNNQIWDPKTYLKSKTKRNNQIDLKPMMVVIWWPSTATPWAGKMRLCLNGDEALIWCFFF